HRHSSTHRSSSPRDLHSFPTRRSSDLDRQRPEGRPRSRVSISSLLSWECCALSPTSAPAPVLEEGRKAPPSSSGLPKAGGGQRRDRKSTRLNSSHVSISYAVFCLKKKT